MPEEPTPPTHRPITARSRRAFILIMVIAIIAIISVAGTGFVIFMREANQASANSARMAQAELAARSGIEHAIAAIEAALTVYASPDGAIWNDGTFHDDPVADGPRAGWTRYFAGSEPIIRYAADHEIKGRTFDLMRGKKRGEYTVYVTDLDGKLHASLPQWSGGMGGDQNGLPSNPAVATGKAVERCGFSGAEAATTATRVAEAPFFASISEMPRRAGLATVAAGKYWLEKHFTVYPVPRADEATPHDVAVAPVYSAASGTSTIALTAGGLTPGAEIGKAVVFVREARAFGIVSNAADAITVRGDCSDRPAGSSVAIFPRPAVNVNTVSEELLVELVKPICSFLAAVDPAEGPQKAEAIAAHICATRPFRDRHEFEETIRRVTGDDAVVDLHDYVPALAVGTHLSERQFNDLLNSAAGKIAGDESAYDDPAAPGVYSFDGWEPFADGVGPAQTGGARTNDADVTWSTEFKFASRFFHVYVLGRGWSDGGPAGIRRGHTIYDAEANRIVWLRWNVSSRGSVTDIGQ